MKTVSRKSLRWKIFLISWVETYLCQEETELRTICSNILQLFFLEETKKKKEEFIVVFLGLYFVFPPIPHFFLRNPLAWLNWKAIREFLSLLIILPDEGAGKLSGHLTSLNTLADL